MMRNIITTLVTGTMAMGLVGTAKADMIYNPTSDFSITNGNPNGVWSYGWMDNAFTSFNLYGGKRKQLNETSPQWYRTPSSGDFTPCIWRNDSSAAASGVAPGQLSLHPSSSYEASVLRFIAPFEGDYHVVGSFLPGDIGSMAVGIRQGHTWLWQATNAGNFDLHAQMTAGGALDFAVYNGYHFGNTPLTLTISTAVPEPSTFVAFASLSLMGVAAAAWRRRRKK